MSTVNEVRMGRDELLRLVRDRPEKVVDALLELCDYQDDLAVRWVNVPLGTPSGVAEGSKLQGEAQALQNLMGTILDKLNETETDE
ncbi:MAG: hypothetical protein B7Z37_03140 [Verrucomicrobia bacterium 12-59-8]|nr:MAG: hypothetical protein B7Z37_03140 [Verrucomicrobia bacterium 12-59-8]